MYLVVINLLLCLLGTPVTGDGSSENQVSSNGFTGHTCAKPFVWTGCGSACKETCSGPRPRMCTLQCVQGCFCPPESPIEKLDQSGGVVSCVATRDECCSGGQVWNDCGSACNSTCEDPTPTCTEQCVPRCQCPAHKPIWKDGKCISLSQCICPDGRCSKVGCFGCNKCQCRNKGAACTRRACPDLQSMGGVQSLYENGCWRRSPSGERCIFYSPCVDQLGPTDCRSHPDGFCEECSQCKCSPDAEGTGMDATCDVNVVSCLDQLAASVDQGCWSYIKGDCRFTYPCLKPDAETCPRNSPGALRTCQACSSCECVHGAKICEQRESCPDPYQDGCYAPRAFPGERAGCYFVSPCPFNSSASDFNQCLNNPTGFVCKSCASCSCKAVLNGQPCPVASCLQPKADFCYAFSEESQTCEFVAPCPKTCENTDNTCDQCNECSCRDGSTTCSFNSCENPITTGCWYNSTSGCEFRVPCPDDAILDPTDFCQTNPGASFCGANDCNRCRCPDHPGGPMACTRKACLPPSMTEGCWKPTGQGSCTFSLPCQ